MVFRSGSWIQEDIKNALCHLKGIKSFEFLYSLITLYRSLFYLKEAVVKLQGKDKDIVSGTSIDLQSYKELKASREDIDAYSKLICDHCCRLAEKSSISVSVPQISQHHRYR